MKIKRIHGKDRIIELNHNRYLKFVIGSFTGRIFLKTSSLEILTPKKCIPNSSQNKSLIFLLMYL